MDSIALNIADESIGHSNPEFKRFIGYAMRSLAEVVTCLHKATRKKYISREEFDIQYAEAFHLMDMIASFKIKNQLVELSSVI